jgi:hypothetical protein
MMRERLLFVRAEEFGRTGKIPSSTLGGGIKLLFLNMNISLREGYCYFCVV